MVQDKKFSRRVTFMLAMHVKTRALAITVTDVNEYVPNKINRPIISVPEISSNSILQYDCKSV